MARLNEFKRSWKRRAFSVLISSLAIIGFLPCLPVKATPDLVPTHRPKMAIIIDDVGNKMKGTEAMFSLKERLTVAVMPFLPSSRKDAILAHQAGDEVILHLPMEADRAPRSWLGPGAITTSMSDDEIRSQVRRDIESIPYVVGLNNHMGSKATRNGRVVRDIVTVAKEKGLFIVDSRTSYKSKMVDIAKEMGVPYVRRSLFLDDDRNVNAIAKQVRLLTDDAKAKGWAIGIGHVGYYGLNTYRGIRAMLPYVKRQGVDIVPVSTLVHTVVE